MADFEILVRGPFARQRLRLVRAAQPPKWANAEDERSIEGEWRRRLAASKRRGVPLFDGRLYRLESYSLDSGTLTLSAGETTYREYVGTRVPRFFSGRDRAGLANPLAVCAAIVTSDERVVVGIRHGVDVDDGRYDVPGGMVDLGDADLFAAIQREVGEELGLALSADDMICSGLIYDLAHPHYELCFVARAGISFAGLAGLHPSELESRGQEGIADSAEALSAFLTAKRGRMSPTGEACLVLYGQMRWERLDYVV